jgi:hypothetical protein
MIANAVKFEPPGRRYELSEDEPPHGGTLFCRAIPALEKERQ